MFVRVKLGAYADPGDASAENKALYGRVSPRGNPGGDTTDLERSGSASHDDHHYEEVPTTDGSEMSEIALNSSTSIENENYENGNLAMPINWFIWR